MEGWENLAVHRGACSRAGRNLLWVHNMYHEDLFVTGGNLTFLPYDDINLLAPRSPVVSLDASRWGWQYYERAHSQRIVSCARSRRTPAKLGCFPHVVHLTRRAAALVSM